MLRSLRTRVGMSQESVAQRAGIHPSYLSQLESGARVPSVFVLERLLVVLGASDQERSMALHEVGCTRVER